MPATPDQNLDVLLDNADFEEQDSLSKAQRFVSAAKRYLLQTPQAQSEQGASLTMNLAEVRALMQRAQQFIDIKKRQTSGAVRFLSAAEGFRR